MPTYRLANPEFMYAPQQNNEGHVENHYDNQHIARSLRATRLLPRLDPYLSRSLLSILTAHFKSQQAALNSRGLQFWTRSMLNHADMRRSRLFYVLVDYRKEPAWLPEDDARLSLLDAFPCEMSILELEEFVYYNLTGEMVAERLKHYSIRKYFPDGQQQEGTTFFKQLDSDWVKVSEIDIAETEDLFATSASLFLYSTL